MMGGVLRGGEEMEKVWMGGLDATKTGNLFGGGEKAEDE